MIEWEILVKCQISYFRDSDLEGKIFNSNKNAFDLINGFSTVITQSLSIYLWFENLTIIVREFLAHVHFYCVICSHYKMILVQIEISIVR